MSLYKSFFSASQSAIALKKKKKKSIYIPVLERKNQILSNEQVREMRIKDRDGIPRKEIINLYPQVSSLHIIKVLNYQVRISPKCDI